MSESTEIATRQTAEVAVGSHAVNDLVAKALDTNTSPETVEKLVALAERVADRQSEAAMNEAMARFQANVPTIAKDRKANIKSRSGGSFAYTYSSLHHIAETIRETLHDCGLSYTWDTALDGQHLTTTCILKHVDGAERRAKFTAPTESNARMSGAQATAAANTYAKRQSLVSVLGLTIAEIDNDGAPPARKAAPITDAQLAELQKLADEGGADIRRFCGVLGVGALAELPAHRFGEAKQMLEEKIRRQGAA